MLIPTNDVPVWVIIVSATAISLGTAVGGWRIMHTMGHRVVKLEPVHGFAAETAASGVILTAAHFGMPVSTTHVISAAIMGVGTSGGACTPSAGEWRAASSSPGSSPSRPPLAFRPRRWLVLNALGLH